MRKYNDRIRFVGFLALILFAIVALPAWGQGTFKLTFETSSEANWFSGWGNPGCDKQEKIPEALKKPHKMLTEDAAYYLVDLNGTKLIAAVRPDPATLIVDTDWDNDLSDETPIKLLDPKEPAKGFGVVTIKREGTDSIPIILSFGYDGTLIPKPGGVYKGKITLADKTYTMVIGDCTFNGHPNDAVEPDKSADMCSIDYNDDGEFDLWDEIRPLSPLSADGKAIYKVSVAPDGSSVTFEPAEVKTGYVNMTWQGGILSLFSAETGGAYRVGLRGEPLPLPVGKYDVFTIQLCAWDDQNRRYRMQVIDLSEKLSKFEIREGETTVLGIGPPMKAKPVPVREGNKIVVNVEVWGSYGERYFPYVRADQGGNVGWAGMVLIDEEGNTLSSGGFEYG